ncbi:MAG TPA: hypothetical protein VG795_11910 [Acidimicrobiia bacterium]|nr:hypothetical protein [Acidimicrobiia bacterium]
MPSTLACVGLAVPDEEALGRLLNDVVPHAARLGHVDGVEVLRWDDPSGARLVLGLRGGEVVDLLPSFADEPTARLASIEFVSEEVATAAVLDDSDEQVTAMALDLEGWRLLRRSPPEGPASASVVALGVDVAVFDDEAAFAASSASLLTPDDSGDEAPPPEYVERGWTWPPRMAAESFLSYGVFAPPEEATLHARLAGTVVSVRSALTAGAHEPRRRPPVSPQRARAR